MLTFLKVYCACFDRTGNRIMTGSDDGLVKVWSSRTGMLLHTLKGHEKDITDVSINDANTLFATGSNDTYVRVWSIKTFAPVAVLQHLQPITWVGFSPCPQGSVLVTCTLSGEMKVWNTLNWDAPPHVLNAGTQIFSASFSPGGLRLVTGCGDGCARIWALHPDIQPRLFQVLRGHQALPIGAISWSHSDSRLVTGSSDGTARLWEFDDMLHCWQCVAVLSHVTTVSGHPPRPSPKRDIIR